MSSKPLEKSRNDPDKKPMFVAYVLPTIPFKGLHSWPMKNGPGPKWARGPGPACDLHLRVPQKMHFSSRTPALARPGLKQERRQGRNTGIVKTKNGPRTCASVSRYQAFAKAGLP